MNDTRTHRIGVGLNGFNDMGSIMAILNTARMRRSKELPEVREARKLLYLENKAEQLRKAKIINNDCPTCGGKLVRGKKNKHNGYKRDWACSKCWEVHSI